MKTTTTSSFICTSILKTVALLGIPILAKADYIVYKVSCNKTIQYWEDNRTDGTKKAGTLNLAQSALVVLDLSDLSQASVHLDTKAKTYRLGAVGEGLEFIDPYGTDPFFPGREVVRNFYEDSRGRQTEFWSTSLEDEGDVLVNEHGAPVYQSGQPVFTTWSSASLQSLKGSLTTLNLGNGRTYTAAASMSGEGSRYLTDPRHVLFTYDTSLVNGSVVGIVEKFGKLHMNEKRKITFSFSAGQTKLVNTASALLDDQGQTVAPGSDRHALLALFSDLKKQRYTPAP
jgi:hypothetical protein